MSKNNLSKTITFSSPKLKRIIDAENYKQVGTFDVKDTEATVKRYTDMGKWEIIHIDYDGDLILNN